MVDFSKLPKQVRLVGSTPLTCDPGTGALVAGVVPKSLAPCDLKQPPLGAIEERYRPSPALQRLIRLRDGHCRFPGCQINARSCDIDHVVAWPAGPTTARNLMCLCRRHHRIKQRPGWKVRLDTDGVVHWTDPGGRSTDTHAVDHLDRLDLPAEESRPGASAGPVPASSTVGRLTSRHPVEITSLLELTMARFLELADSENRRPSPTRIELWWPPRRLQPEIDLAIAYAPLGHGGSSPRVDDPPPF